MPAALSRAACVFLLLGGGGAVYDPEGHIESARLYGNFHALAYFYLDLVVGTPPQRVSVIADTGSSLIAFPCSGCQHCGKHIDPTFNVESSSTAKWLPCGPGCGGSCKKKYCYYSQAYLEGSSFKGYYFQDWVALGDGIQRNPPVYAKMGCHQTEEKLFYTQKANGIMGMAPTERSFLSTLFEDRKNVDSKVFAMCLGEWGGRMTVGGWNTSYHTTGITWVPVDTKAGRLTVTPSELKVDGRVLSKSFGRTFIDSGTTYTYMKTDNFMKLKGAIDNYCDAHNQCGGTKVGRCWNLNSPKDLDNFPVASWIIAGKEYQWTAKAYLHHNGKSYCLSFADDGRNAGTTLGASWMQHHDHIFDLKRHKFGFAAANCPFHQDRPNHEVFAPLSGGNSSSTHSRTVEDLDSVNPPEESTFWWWTVCEVVGLVSLTFFALFLVRHCQNWERYSKVSTTSPPIPNRAPQYQGIRILGRESEDK